MRVADDFPVHETLHSDDKVFQGKIIPWQLNLQNLLPDKPGLIIQGYGHRECQLFLKQ